MSYIEIIILAFGLAMDAFAVSICSGGAVKGVKVSQSLAMAVVFGLFQAIMPVIGWALGNSFAELIVQIDHWIAFILLGGIGSKMIVESVRSKGGENCCCESESTSPFGFRKIVVLGVATSIDALAVGIPLASLQVNIWIAASHIGVITFVLSFLGVKMGRRLRGAFSEFAEISGGVVLIVIGVKILIEHLFFQ